ncbi:hypothetical protein LTR28_012487, partial [Elasticomyces elasticus]
RVVFGVPLAEAVDFSSPSDVNVGLPAVVYRCIEYLTAKQALYEEGIFRLSGSNIVIKALRDRFNAEGDVNLLAEDQYYDIHAVASLLKLYLRELPASILTRELHLDFLQRLDLEGDAKLEAFNALVHRLPKANRDLLTALCKFLLEIVTNADVNKMNVRNVGIVFAPTLNIPAPLISHFVSDFNIIFGPTITPNADSPIKQSMRVDAANLSSDAIRSPRKQLFTDVSTPAYHQTTFAPLQQQQQNSSTRATTNDPYDAGFVPLRTAYEQPPSHQATAQGDGAFGSLNDALGTHKKHGGSLNGAMAAPAPVAHSRDSNNNNTRRKRESGVVLLSMGLASQGKKSLQRLRDAAQVEEGAKF